MKIYIDAHAGHITVMLDGADIIRRTKRNVSVTLTQREAVELADKLNKALDDPDERRTQQLLKGK